MTLQDHRKSFLPRVFESKLDQDEPSNITDMSASGTMNRARDNLFNSQL